MTPTIASLLAALVVWGTRIEWRVRRGQRPAREHVEVDG